jgi:hypothetical protein
MTYNINMCLTLHGQYIGKVVLYVKIICPYSSHIFPYSVSACECSRCIFFTSFVFPQGKLRKKSLSIIS